MNKPLTVYKASAGSGKTFTLATEYIKLVVRNPQSYRNILAVTFTNKATEEMKMRILSQLYGIWKQLPDSRRYTEKVTEGLRLPDDEVSRRAGQALTLLLHNYSYFRVETIDSFFQSVLRNLARELDLTANLRIGLNDTQVEELAVDQMIDDLTTSDVVLQWILKYVMDNIGDDQSWNVIHQIKDFGKTIFRDYYKSESRRLNEKLSEPGFFDNYTKRLHQLRQTARTRMEELAESFFNTLADEGFTVDDLSHGKSGLASLFIKLRSGAMDESIVGKRALDAVGQPEKWYRKTHPRREVLHALADGPLGRLLRQTLEERPRQWRLYQSATLTLRHLSQLRLLNTIEDKVRQLNDTQNRFLLSDTQQLLHALIGDSDSPFIFEKIGTQLEHIMIDEFQDTSTVQWQNFRHLLLETMSHRTADNLIVGDVKQSIYRWRSGDWRLLNDIESQFPAGAVDERSLDVNYRSARHVIEFNNDFFKRAAQLEYRGLEDYPEAAHLARAYADVVQQVPDNRGAEGYVSISLLPQADYRELTLQRLVDTVYELRAQGCKDGSMAILVRTNSFIPIIASYFAEHAPEVSIVSDEAFRLDASLAVNIMVQGMRLLVNPDDQLARAFLLQNTVPSKTNLAPRTSHLVARNSPLTSKDFTSLVQTPLYELGERLFTLFGLECMSDQSAYVCAFFDQLMQFASENATGVSGFLKAWDEELCGKTIQSDEAGGIRLISIHKSKGLEFENVIIPFCDWQLEKTSGNILWCRPAEAPFNELPIVPVDYSQKGMMGTVYEDHYRHEHLQNVVDNLNLLYVAFTRASERLFVIGRRKSSNSRSAIIEQTIADNVAEGVWDATRLTGADDEQLPLCFEYGSRVWETAPSIAESPVKDDSPLSSKDDSADSPHSNVFLQTVVPQPVAVTSYEPRLVFRQSNRSKDFIASIDDSRPSTSYIQTGRLLHTLFSSIRTADDIEPVLAQLQSEGIITRPDQLAAMLRQRLSHPTVADWFSPRWKLFNECTILSIGSNGQTVERRPDRVMTDGNEWVVVDFKFGSPNSDYHDQVREYMSLLAEMGHTTVRGWLWYVYSGVVEQVYNG